MDEKFIIMTPDLLTEFVEKIAEKIKGNNAPQPLGKRYVYGLRGIGDLFDVSHATAQKYKDTFLKPAIVQRGRKIVVDADLAMELYKQHQSA